MSQLILLQKKYLEGEINIPRSWLIEEYKQCSIQWIIHETIYKQSYMRIGKNYKYPWDVGVTVDIV